MEIFLEYAWVLVVLVALEGLLAADNAVVMAVMVKHLPEEQRKKALFYGLVGALFFRFAALFMITILVEKWWIQAIGAAYLLFVSIKSLVSANKSQGEEGGKEENSKGKGFWATVIKVELADIAFAIDSMLAAVVLAVTLPEVTDINIGGINAGQFAVMFVGGVIGLVIMRFAAQKFVEILVKRPNLEKAAFVIVGWVGIKLVVLTLCHEKIGILPTEFSHSLAWKSTFWIVLILIVLIGWFKKPSSEK